MLSRRSSFASFAALLLAASLVAAACGDGISSAAFTVDGRETTQRDFDDELDALADNEGFVALYEGGGEAVRNSEGTVSSQLAAAWATIVIQWEIMTGAVESDGIEVTGEDRSEAEAEAVNLFGAGEQGEAVWAEFPEWFRDRVLERLTGQVAYLRSLAAPPGDEEIQAFFEEFVERCPTDRFVSHILVESEGEANDILAELDAGASFAQLAGERSTEPGAEQSGGFLDCFQEGAFVPEFEAAVIDAAIDSTVGPVETQFGWHVIRVDAEPPFDVVRARIEETVRGLAQQDTLVALLEGAQVEVDPRYGTWVVDELGGRVEPPEPAIDDPPEPAPGDPGIEVPEPGDPQQAPPPPSP